MKKPAISPLVLVTCVFASLVVGFFAGRNLNRTPVRISALPTVASAEEASPEVPSKTATTPTEPGIIDINTATLEQFQTLPGIGPVLAQRIIDYREENGPFQATEELAKVSGIGSKRLEEILDLITVGG